MQTIEHPLTNAQLEILKTFSHQLSEKDLLELRNILADFFSRRTIEAANKAWDKKGWTNDDVDRLLNTKLRKRS